MRTPLVSAVIASWNAAEFLPATLATAVAQTWPNLEVIVVDDGSTDDTARAIAPFLPRIRYQRRSHQGLAAARNEGLRLAAGDYIALLDADDLWHPEKVAVQVEIAGRYPETGLLACNGVEFAGDVVLQPTLLFDPFTDAIEASGVGEVTADFQRALIVNNGICCPSQVMIPRRVVAEIGPFIDSGAQDYDYYLRVSREHPITLHHHCHTRWRYRPDSMSGVRDYRWIRWGLDSLPVLAAHRTRCRPEDRDLLEARLTKWIHTVGYALRTQGREQGRLAASAKLVSLLGVWPSRATTLKHLAALWTPDLVHRSVTRWVR